MRLPIRLQQPSQIEILFAAHASAFANSQFTGEKYNRRHYANCKSAANAEFFDSFWLNRDEANAETKYREYQKEVNTAMQLSVLAFKRDGKLIAEESICNMVVPIRVSNVLILPTIFL